MKSKVQFDQPRDEIKVNVPNPGGFWNGLALGAIAGAAGFFLWGTKKGKTIKKNLVKEIKNLSGELQEAKRECCPDEPKKLPAKNSKSKKPLP